MSYFPVDVNHKVTLELTNGFKIIFDTPHIYRIETREFILKGITFKQINTKGVAKDYYALIHSGISFAHGDMYFITLEDNFVIYDEVSNKFITIAKEASYD